MERDSKEKIIKDWNKMMGPYPINRALGYDKAYIPEIDVEAIYRKLKK